jgi:SAM-dependent methyltransferase
VAVSRRSPPEDPAALHRNRARASSFGANAELYDRSRPRYPDAMIDALLASAPSRVLDVGCGTGLLGRSFVERGVPVLGVEPDAQMAAVARRHGLDVEIATFEGWDPAGRVVDLLVAGQSWHWVEPERGAHKAADVVRPGGGVAHAWNVGAMEDELGEALNVVYDAIAPGQARPLVPHRRGDRGEPSASELAFSATGAFAPPEHHTYDWEHVYATDEWLAQLETHSDHALMSSDARARLLEAVGEVLDARGGAFTMYYACEVTYLARR